MLDSQGMTIAETKKMIELLWKADRHPLLLGDRGIGKSATAFQVATENLEVPVYYLNCSQVDAESLVYPTVKTNEVLDSDGKIINIDKSIDLVTIDGLNQRIVVILDEITNARPSLHSLLLSFVADKRIGSRHFPEVLFIATGNKTEHSSLAQPLPRPLMERFCIIEAPIPSREEWIIYMQSRFPQVPAYYYSFIHNMPESMFHEKETEGGDVENFKQMPSPRSHTYSASVLSEFPTVEEARSNMTTLYHIFKGFLGDSLAARFIAHLEDENNFLSYGEYLKGKKPTTASQVINLAMDAAEKLKPEMEKSNKDKWCVQVDSLINDIHKSKLTALTQFVFDVVTHTTPNNRHFKSHIVSWARSTPDSCLSGIIKERQEMQNMAGAKFSSAITNR